MSRSGTVRNDERWCRQFGRRSVTIVGSAALLERIDAIRVVGGR
jgi:hypothetical protein